MGILHTYLTTTVLRIIQIVCGLVSFGSLIELSTSGYSQSEPLTVSATWASTLPAMVAGLSIAFFKKPLEQWSFTLTLDVLSLISFVGAIGCCVGNGAVWYPWLPQHIVSVTAVSIGSIAFAITATRTVLLYRRHVERTRPDDPLKPYLMKKEIDVWCYPVQNEQGQLFMDYEPVSSTGASKAPSAAASMRSRSVKSFVRVDDQAPRPATSRPQSSVETTAGWSVPSGNETLQTFQRSQMAPSTTLPSYRS